MDGTLLEGRLIHNLAERLGFADKLYDIQINSSLPGYKKTERIATLLKGNHQDEIVRSMKEMKIIKNWRKTIEEFKAHGYVLGIISDSYTLACNYLAEKMNLDFVVANKLEFDRENIITGLVSMPLGWEKIGCNCKISVCKKYHLEKTAKKFRIPLSDTIVLGDTLADLCMIKHAGIGIAMMPKDKTLEEESDIVIKTHELDRIVPFVL